MSVKKRAEIESAILELISERGPGQTICPSEVARRLFEENVWREEMDAVREVAQDLIERRLIEATQKGKVVKSVLAAHGPIRLRKANS